MLNFTYYNPVKIVFGRGSIARLPELIPAGAKVMLIYGGGSIKRNGVYDQVFSALRDNPPAEFGGVEPNPQYETCLRAVERVRAEGIDFLLGVGGGSAMDTAKFVAAAAAYPSSEPWEMVYDWSRTPADSLPVGCIPTLAATGSEMNFISVISRRETREKLSVKSPYIFPRFSILDPATTCSLPVRQTANGVVDAFSHVAEQYMTYPADTPLQDRQAEAILLTLIEEGPKALREPENYAVRANLMWSAAQALNSLIGCGVPQDWSSHMLGHQLTALYGIDHARSLAVVMPGVWRQQFARKKAKLAHYAARVWDIRDGGEDSRARRAIDRTEEFFHSLGVPTRLSDYDIPADAAERVASRAAKLGRKLGEHQDLTEKDLREILALRA